jgi:hypothetical protein
VDFYTKYTPLKKVIKFSMSLKVIINGVQQTSSGVNIGSDDHIEIKYKFSEHS